MKRAFILLVVVVSILASAFGSFFFIALLPFADVAGKLLIGLLAIAIGCLATAGVAYTYFYVCILAARKRREDLHSKLVITNGVVAWPNPDGTFVHLSAQLEEARAVKQLPAPSVTVEPVDKDGLTPSQLKDIKELFDEGNTNPTIADSLGIPKWKVQKITAPWRLTPKTAMQKSD